MKDLCYDIYQKCQSTSCRPVGRYIVPEITVIKDVVVLRPFYAPEEQLNPFCAFTAMKSSNLREN